MLSKVDSSSVTIPAITETTQLTNTIKISYNSWFVLFFDLTTEKLASYSLNITPGYQYYWLKIVVNGNTFMEDTTMVESSAQRSFNLWELNKWANIKIYFKTWASSFWNVTLNGNITASITKIYKQWKKSKIFTLKNIWEKLTGYLFGKLPDGTRRDGN